MRRRIVGLLLLAASSVLARAGTQEGATSGGEPISNSSGPSIVLLTVESLRADRLGCYGYDRPTTPHLDALAESAVLYRRAYAAASWANPSLAALMTSREPASLGIVDIRSSLPADVATLAQRLANTHSTIGVVANPFTTSSWGFDRGFELYDQKYTAIAIERSTAVGVTDQALRFLGRCEPPYFLWVQYMDPHAQYQEHPEFGFEGPANYSGKVAPGMAFAELRKGARRLAEPDLEQLRSLYDSEVRSVDEQIGRLLDSIRSSTWFDDALVVVTSDHGEEFLEHGSLGNGSHLGDELVHVPLIVKYPGQSTAVTIDQLVGLVDVVPTVLDLTGTARSPDDVGRPLPRTAEEGDDSRTLFLETTKTRHLRAAVTQRWKLIRNVERNTTMLFDLAADPTEQSDCAASRPEVVAELGTALDAWVAATKLPAEPAPRVELEEREVNALTSLGENIEEAVDGTGLRAPAEGVDQFVSQWNDGDLDQLSTLFPLEGERPEWRRFQAFLDENGWTDQRPRIRTITLGRLTPKSAVYFFQIAKDKVEIRWQSKPGGWTLTGIRLNGGE